MATVEFHGQDLVVKFRQNTGTAAVRYTIQYKCGTSTVTHTIDQAAYASIDANGQRHYLDTLLYKENEAAGLTRTPTVTLHAYAANGDSSTPLIEYAQNSIPVLAVAPTITSTVDGVQVELKAPDDGDVAGYRAYVGSTQDFTPADANLRIDTASTSFQLPLGDTLQHWLIIVPYDAFGFDPASAYQAVSIQRGDVNSALAASATIKAIQAAVSDAQSDVTDAKNEVAQVRTDLTSSVQEAQSDAAEAKTQAATARSDAAQVRTDLVPDIAAAKQEGTQARTDLATEVIRAQGAEGTLSTRVTTAQQTADGASTAITTETTQRTNADAALANRTTTIESVTNAGASGGSVNANPYFSGWPTTQTLPTGWSQWNGAGTISRTNSENNVAGTNAVQLVTNSTGELALVQAISVAAGWYVMEADVNLTSGSWVGSGLTLSGQYNLNFASDQDTNGVVSSTQTGRRKFSKLYQIAGGDSNFHPMANWSVFGASAKTIIFYRATFRAASDGEIKAQKADATLNTPGTGVVARLTVEETTRAANDLSLGNRATTLEGSVNNATTGLVATYTKVATEETTRASQDTALSNRIGTLESSVNTPSTGLTARITAEETTRAAQDAALATRATTLETTTNAAPSNSVNANPYFASWPNASGLPSGWTAWNASGTIQRTNSESGVPGTYGVLYTATNTGQLGMAQVVPLVAGWYVIEADVYLTSGSWVGSGVTIGGAYNLSFASDPDSNGTVTSTALGRRKFSKLFNIAASDATNFHPMANWDGFGASTAKTLVFYRCAFRQASDGEIKAHKADLALNTPTTGVIARLTTEELTRSSADTAISNRTSNLESTVNNGTSGVAATYARIGVEETTRASADTSLANRAYTLETRAGNSAGSATANPYFAAWPDGSAYPSQWQLWAPGTFSREASSFTSGGYMLGHVVPDTNDSGLYTTFYTSVGYWVLEASVWCSAGSFQGAGIYVDNLPGINFATTPDNAGNVGAGTTGVRNWSLIVQAPTSRYASLYAMGNWSANGTTTAKTLHWLRCAVRPATDGEIKAQKADATLNNPGGIVARMSFEETTRASQDTALSNRIGTIESTVNTPTTGLTARMSTEENTRANAVSALANRANTLETRFGNSSSYTNANANFAAWQDGGATPSQWGVWNSGTFVRENVSFTSGGYAVYHNCPQADQGLSTTFYVVPGYWVYEASAWVSTGTFQGAGCYADNLPSLNFSTVPDSNGTTGVGGLGIRTWSYMVQHGYTGQVNLYAMSNWGGFGTTSAKVIHWLKCGIRPATDGEIKAQKADATLNNPGGVVARITSEESTRASQDSALSNRIGSLESNVFTGGTGLLARMGIEETTRANADNAIANRTSTLESNYTRLKSNPNLLGPVSDWSGITTFYNSPYWGSVIQWNGVYQDQEILLSSSPHVPLAPNATYTLSGDLLGYGYNENSGNPNVYSSMDVIVYDANSNMVLDGPNTPGCLGDFDDNRAIGTFSVTFTTPSTASFGVVRLLGNARGGTSAIGCRKVKLERGTVATGFSSEAALAMTAANIQNESTTRANADSALSARTSSLESAFNTPGSGVWARISNEENTRASADNALSSRTGSLESNYTAVRTDLNNWNNDRYNQTVNVDARVANEEITRANADGALSSRTSSLESTVGNTVSRVSTAEGAINNLNGRAAAFWQVQTVAGNNRAQLTVRADANGGAGVDIVGDVNFSGNLNVGPDSGQRTKIDNSGVRVYDSNNVLRVRLGLF